MPPTCRKPRHCWQLSANPIADCWWLAVRVILTFLEAVGAMSMLRPG
jgi:hypothetical protein